MPHIANRKAHALIPALATLAAMRFLEIAGLVAFMAVIVWFGLRFQRPLARHRFRWAGLGVVLFLAALGLIFLAHSVWGIAPALLGVGIYLAAAWADGDSGSSTGETGAYGSPFDGGDFNGGL